MILPLTSSGLVATAMISHTDVYPGGYLAPNQINALGDMVTLGLSYPIIARAQIASLLTLNFDLFNNSSSVFKGAITTSDERSRAVRFGTLTTVSDNLGGQTTINAYYSQGINALFGARPNDNQLDTRPGMDLERGQVRDRRAPRPGATGRLQTRGRTRRPTRAGPLALRAGDDFRRCRLRPRLRQRNDPQATTASPPRRRLATSSRSATRSCPWSIPTCSTISGRPPRP